MLPSSNKQSQFSTNQFNHVIVNGRRGGKRKGRVSLSYHHFPSGSLYKYPARQRDEKSLSSRVLYRLASIWVKKTTFISE